MKAKEKRTIRNVAIFGGLIFGGLWAWDKLKAADAGLSLQVDPVKVSNFRFDGSAFAVQMDLTLQTRQASPHALTFDFIFLNIEVAGRGMAQINVGKEKASRYRIPAQEVGYLNIPFQIPLTRFGLSAFGILSDVFLRGQQWADVLRQLQNIRVTGEVSVNGVRLPVDKTVMSAPPIPEPQPAPAG